MTNYVGVIIVFFLALLVISAGCITPPGSDRGKTTTVTPTPKSTNIVTTATTAPPSPPLYPLFNVAQVALKTKGGTSGLAIVSVSPEIGMYGTLEVKKASNMWYTDGVLLVTWKPISDIDKAYKFFDTGIDPANIPIGRTGVDSDVPESSPCYGLGDWNVNNGASTYKLRNDFVIVNQTGNEIKIGSWKTIRTPDKLSYFINWDYGPGPNYPLYAEIIEVSKDFTKFSGINNYGKAFSGTWTYAHGPIGTEKKCSEWLGGNEWYKNLN